VPPTEKSKKSTPHRYLDITPLGRQETWEDSLEDYPQTPPYKWWNWHDNYDAARLTRSGSRCPMLEKPPSESATQTRKHDQVYGAGQRASVRLLVVVKEVHSYSTPAVLVVDGLSRLDRSGF
jgi:hypothetical protein